MDITDGPPAFGAKLRPASYYEQVSNICRILRKQASLRVIAQHLNNQQFTTPTGLIWTRERVADYLKSTAYKGN